MEIVMVWSMLVWNEPSIGVAQHDRLSVSTTDNLYHSEEECRGNARLIIERLPKARIACVLTHLAKAERESMKQYEQFIDKNLPVLPNPTKP